MIGVFDFGSGGLTVMRAFESVLPNEHFVYLGDHGNAPYGSDATDSIHDLTQAALARLFSHGCTLVVIACNTAVAISLRKLQQGWLSEAFPGRRVIGVIAPIAEALSRPFPVTTFSEHALFQQPVENVAIFATRHTVESNAFAMEINKRNPDIKVSQQACHGLALLIEQDAPESVLHNEIAKNVDALLSVTAKVPDVCILGCTHYPIVEHIWRMVLPDSVRILSQSNACALSLVDYLEKNPQFSNVGVQGNQFFTTGEVQAVSERASLFYRSRVQFSKLD